MPRLDGAKDNMKSSGPSREDAQVSNNYYIRLMAFFQDNLGKPAPERQTILDFAEARDDGVAVASAEPYANHLHLDPDR